MSERVGEGEWWEAESGEGEGGVVSRRAVVSKREWWEGGRSGGGGVVSRRAVVSKGEW